MVLIAKIKSQLRSRILNPRWALLAAILLAASAATMFSAQVQAQNYPQGDRILDVQLFHPGVAPEDFLNVMGSPLPKHGDFVLSAFMTYMYKPLVTGIPGGGPGNTVVVEHQMGWELAAAVGLWDRFLFGVAMPVSMFQFCQDAPGTSSCNGLLAPSGLSDANFEGGGIGDLRVLLRGAIIQREAGKDGFGLGAGAIVTFPTGDATAFVGESNHSDIDDPTSSTSAFRATGNLFAAADYAMGPWRFGANLGFLLRRTGDWGAIDLSNELQYGLAAAYWFNDWLAGIAEVDARWALGDFETQSSPHEALFAGRIRHGAFRFDSGVGVGMVGDFGAPDVRWFGGVTFTGSITGADSDGDGVVDLDDACEKDAEDKDGFEDQDGCPEIDNDKDGIPDGLDKCPNVAAVTADGCPLADSDGDTIADDLDRCPAQAEDRDNFEDSDGCPEADNDQDGVADKSDKCPDQGETFNNFEDDDGCPDQAPVLATAPVITAEKIEIGQRIEFVSGKATLTDASMGVLDSVADVINKNPQLKVIRVEGHTDSKGRPQSNQRLSQKRAESVRRYLIQKGVSERRVQAVGYGATRPIADNGTDEGRAQNRRVEFIIVEQSE